MPHHVVVIGAGPGGLTAAVLLAKAGVRVTIVERPPYLGGRTSTFTQNGFRFDQGATFFHYPEMLEGILQSVGYNLWRELDLIRLDPRYRLVFGSGGELIATSNLRKLQSAVAQSSPPDASRISAFLVDNRKSWIVSGPSWITIPQLARHLPIRCASPAANSKTLALVGFRTEPLFR